MDLTFKSQRSPAQVIAVDEKVAWDHEIVILQQNLEDLHSIDIKTPFLAEMCGKKGIELIQARLPSIFKGSRCNPYRHSVLTYQIGSLNAKLHQIKSLSDSLTAIQDDMQGIFLRMLRLRLLSEIKLTSVPELDRYIACLVLQNKAGFETDQVERIRSLYCVLPENTMVFGHLKLAQFVAPHFVHHVEREQAEANRKAFVEVLAQALNREPQIDAHFQLNEEESKTLSPLLTFYSDGLRKGLGISREEFFETAVHLTSLSIVDLSGLSHLPHPEKVQRLKTYCSDSWLDLPSREDAPAFRKFVNVEHLEVKERFGDWTQFSAGKLKTLSVSEGTRCITRHFLSSCSALESLIYLPEFAPDANLSMLPHPEKLRLLHVKHCKNHSSESFANFVNLETLVFHCAMENMPQLKCLDKLPNLRRLTVHLGRNFDLNGALQQCPRCPQVEQVTIFLFQNANYHVHMNHELLWQKFPNLKEPVASFSATERIERNRCPILDLP